MSYDIACFFGRPASGKTGPVDDAEKNGYQKRVCSDDVKAYYADPSIVATSDSGAMWSDETVTTVMGLHLSKDRSGIRGFGLDGYVRSPGQFAFLMDYVRRNNWKILVIWIDTPAAVCSSRAETRRQEYIAKGLKPRRDDEPEVHGRRLREYDEYGPATISSFEGAGVPVVRIDGRQSPEQVILESRSAIMGLVMQ